MDLTLKHIKIFINKNKLILLLLLFIFLIILEINNLEILVIILVIILIYYFKYPILEKLKSFSVENFKNTKPKDIEYTNKIILNDNIDESMNELNIPKINTDNPAGNGLPGNKFIDKININNCEDNKDYINLDDTLERKNKIIDNTIQNGKYKNQYTKKYLERTFYIAPKFHNTFNTDIHNKITPTKKEQFLEPCNYKSELLK